MAGLLTLIGWFGHVPQLTDWVNSGISMFANTAVAAVCAGAALILSGMSSRWMQRLSAVLGSVVLAIGAATLFQHILGLNLGIDELLTRHSWGIKAAVAPGRMGPPASTCFTVIGIALLFLRAGPRVQRAASVMGMLVAAISMLSLIGYLFGAQALFSLADWTGIVETELFAPTYKSYGLATVRYPVLEIEARVESFENGRGYSLRALRAGKPRTRS